MVSPHRFAVIGAVLLISTIGLCCCSSSSTSSLSWSDGEVDGEVVSDLVPPEEQQEQEEEEHVKKNQPVRPTVLPRALGSSASDNLSSQVSSLLFLGIGSARSGTTHLSEAMYKAWPSFIYEGPKAPHVLDNCACSALSDEECVGAYADALTCPPDSWNKKSNDESANTGHCAKAAAENAKGQHVIDFTETLVVCHRALEYAAKILPAYTQIVYLMRDPVSRAFSEVSVSACCI